MSSSSPTSRSQTQTQSSGCGINDSQSRSRKRKDHDRRQERESNGSSQKDEGEVQEEEKRQVKKPKETEAQLGSGSSSSTSSSPVLRDDEYRQQRSSFTSNLINEVSLLPSSDVHRWYVPTEEEVTKMLVAMQRIVRTVEEDRNRPPAQSLINLNQIESTSGRDLLQLVIDRYAKVRNSCHQIQQQRQADAQKGKSKSKSKDKDKSGADKDKDLTHEETAQTLESFDSVVWSRFFQLLDLTAGDDEHRYDATRKDLDGHTALLLLCKIGDWTVPDSRSNSIDLQLAERLLKLGADVHARTPHKAGYGGNHTPLTLIPQRPITVESIHIIKLLLLHGADPNAREGAHKDTFMHSIIAQLNFAVLQRLYNDKALHSAMSAIDYTSRPQHPSSGSLRGSTLTSAIRHILAGAQSNTERKRAEKVQTLLLQQCVKQYEEVKKQLDQHWGAHTYGRFFLPPDLRQIILEYACKPPSDDGEGDDGMDESSDSHSDSDDELDGFDVDAEPPSDSEDNGSDADHEQEEMGDDDGQCMSSHLPSAHVLRHRHRHGGIE